MRISDWSSDVCSSDLARGKAFSGTAQNDDTNIVVDIGLFQYGEQFAPQLIAHGVALLRTIERHPQDRFAGPVDLQIFEAIIVSAHAISLHVRSIAGILFGQAALRPMPCAYCSHVRTFCFGRPLRYSRPTARREMARSR